MNTTFNPILKQNAYGKNGPADAALRNDSDCFKDN